MSSEERKPQGLFAPCPVTLCLFDDVAEIPASVPQRPPPCKNGAFRWWTRPMAGELARMVGPRFAAWLMAVVEERTSDDVASALESPSEKSVRGDQHDEEQVLEHLLTLVERVMDRA